MADPVNIADLSAADLAQIAQVNANAPASAAAQEGPIDIKSLSPKDLAAISAANATHPHMGSGEAAARLFYKHLTFGTEPGADKAKSEQAAAEHPIINIGSAIPAFVAQTAALGPLAAAGKAVEGAGLLARGARLAGSAAETALLPNTDAATALQAARTGAKVGGVYSGIEAAGSDLTDPNKTTGDLARDVALSGGLGTLTGGVLGGAAHGAGRVVGAGMNRMLPELQPVLAAAKSPEGQGARDIMRQLGYDNYSLDDLRNVRQAMDDPAQAHRFANLNLIEALETQPLEAMPGTGELKPGIKVSPNIRDMAQDFANTGGMGRQQAIEAFASRKNEMSATVQQEIDALTAGHQAAPNVEDLPKIIDNTFGSGQRTADAEGIAAQKQAFDKRFDALRKQPLMYTNELGEVYRQSPVFQKAVNYAAQNDAVSAAMAAKGAPSEAGGLNAWLKGMATSPEQPTVMPGAVIPGSPSQTVQILKPSNILDIYHALVMNSKARVGGDPVEMAQATQLKNWFGNWVERQFKGYKNLNNDYRVFKDTMAASDHGGNLSIAGGGPKDREAMQFLQKATTDYGNAVKDTQAKTAAYDAAMQRFQGGSRKTAPQVTDLKNSLAQAESRQGVIDEFRKSLGENWKEQLARSQNPDALIRQATTEAGQNRLQTVLGNAKGPAFIDNLLSLAAKKVAADAPLNAPVSHPSRQFFARMLAEGRQGPADAYRKAFADKIVDALSQASSSNAAGTNSIIDKLLTQAGKEHILQMWGPEQGKRLIEQLYNKQMQAGFSKTLYGGPDTAYKLARNKKTDALMDAVHGILHLRPMAVVKAVHEIGSAGYKQRRADMGNVLLSKQGPAEVGPVIDSLLAGQQLQQTGHPLVRNPLLRAIGPVAGPDTLSSLLRKERERR